MKTRTRTAGLAALLALLAACGGDDSDGAVGVAGAPTAATADFTADNYATQTNTAAQTVLDTSGIVSPLNASIGGPGINMAGGMTIASAGRFIGRSPGRGGMAAGREKASATETDSLPCDTGRLVITSTFASEEATTVGDTQRLVSEGCRLQGIPVLGAVSLAVTSVSASATAESGAFSVNWESFGAADVIITGPSRGTFALTETSTSLELDFAGVSANVRGRNERWFQKAAFVQSGIGDPTLNYSGFITIGDLHVKVDQITPFTFNVNTGRLRSGTLQLTDRDGARVRVFARATRFEYHYFEASNQTATPDRITLEGLQYGG